MSSGDQTPAKRECKSEVWMILKELIEQLLVAGGAVKLYYYIILFFSE